MEREVLASLEQMTQYAADLLECPVVIFDPQLKVLSFSSHVGEVDEGRLLTILNRKAPPKAVEMIRDARANSADRPVVLPPAEGNGARIFVPLRHSENLQGYLSLAAQLDDTEETIDAYITNLTSLTDTIAATLAVDSTNHSSATGSDKEALKQLFSSQEDERLLGAAEIMQKIFSKDTTDLPVSAAFSLILLTDFTSTTSLSTSAQIEIEAIGLALLREYQDTAISGIIDNTGYIIVPRKISASEVAAAFPPAVKVQLFAGISSGQPDLSTMLDAKREAFTAAKFAALRSNSETVAHWDDLGIDRILLQLPLRDMKFTDLPDALQALLSTESNIDLVETLNKYLQSSGDMQETARRLNIHRSTLYYRLDKIKELTGADLADGETRRLLHTGLRVAELAGFWTE